MPMIRRPADVQRRRSSNAFGFDNSQTVDGNNAVLAALRLQLHLRQRASDAAARRRRPVPRCVGQRLAGQPVHQYRFDYTDYSIQQSCIRSWFRSESWNPPRPGHCQRRPIGAQSRATSSTRACSQPSVWKANLAFDHELPWWGIVASAELVLTSGQGRHLLPAVSTWVRQRCDRLGQDGRPIYWNAAGLNPALEPSGGTASSMQAMTLSGNNCVRVSSAARPIANAHSATPSIARHTNKGKAAADGRRCRSRSARATGPGSWPTPTPTPTKSAR